MSPVAEQTIAEQTIAEQTIAQQTVADHPGRHGPAVPSTSGSLRGRTVVFLHAHPDDEAIFTAATMHRLAAAGARVVLVTATTGDLGLVLRSLRAGETLADRRRVELERACDVLGVARLVQLDHRDSGMA